MFEVIELGGVKTVTTRSACNHVYVVDVSGSMYHDLPKIRQNMKNIISVVAQEEDTFSVIYFSGKGQCGVVFENVLVSDISTIQMMHTAIDRFIKPIGLTGFVEPIQLAMDLKLDPSKLNNFIMMSDGWDNQSSKDSIMEKVAMLPSKFASVSFIEYGYYADRDLISKMASITNGVHIFADGFEKYESAMSESIGAVPRVNNIDVKVNKAAKHCVFIYNGQIRIVNVEDGVAKVPEDVERVHSVVPKDVLSKRLSEDHLYLIMFYAAKQDNSELVWNVLQMLGDVALINKYTNAFTKQELSDFESMVESAVLDKDKRFVEGKDLTLVPSKNAPTVLQLLNSLANVNAELVLNSPYWNYTRTGRGSVAQDELPRFVPSPLGNVALNNLVFSSERPNVSIQTTVNGVVELPENDHKLTKVPSFITRNYTIVKDGILNVEHLPVVISQEDFEGVKNFSHEVIEVTGDKVYVVFNLRKTPVINRAMVEDISLEEFSKSVVALNTAKAAIKVLGHKIEMSGGTTDKVKGLVTKYGEPAALWLSSIGVRDYGFSPVNTKSAEASDEYESIQVSCKIKGMSSLPAISAVEKKLKENKNLTVADSLLKSMMDKFQHIQEVDDLVEAKNSLVKTKRLDEVAIARSVYSLVLGRKWFGSDEVVTTTVEFAGVETQLSIEKTRKMIEI